MVALCNIDEVARSINTTADDLVKKFGDYVASQNTGSQYSAGSTGLYRTMSEEQTTILYENTALFNHFIHTPEIKSTITHVTYPNISNRIIKNGFITPYEVDSFISDSMVFNENNFLSRVYTPESFDNFRSVSRNFVERETDEDFTSYLRMTNDDVSRRLALEEFEYYLGSLFETNESVSSFCEMVPDIFAKIERFYGLFNKFKNISGFVSDKLLKITNSISGASFSQLETTVTSHIDKTFKDQMSRLKNSTLAINTEFSNIRARIANKFTEMRDKALNFFTEENLDRIKDVVKAQIQFALDFFKDPDIEEIQYIIYRFCSLLSTLKHVFKSQIEPLSKAMQAYNETNLALRTVSGATRAGAIRAGAIRFEPQQYEAVKGEQMNFIQQRSNEENGNYNPKLIEVTPEDIENVTPWNDGKGDSKIGFQGRWVSILGAEGWNGASPKAKRMLMQVQQMFGKRLLVNSAYRPAWYNEKIGGATRSKHIDGIAFDITWSGFNANEADNVFVPIARKVGFSGIGRYRNFRHIDLGSNRTWNG